MLSMCIDRPEQVAARNPSSLIFVESSIRAVRTQPKAQIAEIHQFGDTLLLHQAVDERHAAGGLLQPVVENGAALRGVDELPVERDRFGVQDLLQSCRTPSSGRSLHPCSAGEWGECLHLARLAGQQHFVQVREATAFASR